MGKYTEDETCINCPVRQGREELCEECFKKKMKRHDFLKQIQRFEA